MELATTKHLAQKRGKIEMNCIDTKTQDVNVENPVMGKPAGAHRLRTIPLYEEWVQRHL